MMQEWISAAKTGDESAWAILFNQYYPSLFAQALKLCGSGSVAKDAVQDSFVTAFLKLGQLRDPATFGAWLRKILVHTCYRLQHKHRRHSHKEIIPDSGLHWEDTLNHKLDDATTQNRLYTTLAQLPEVLRSTMMLRHFSRFQTYEEIASILAIPIGTVRSRMNQAKAKLAAHWQQQDDAGGTVLRQSEEWNRFYYSHFGGMHAHNDVKDRLLHHFDKNTEVVYTSGKPGYGRQLIEKEVHEDRRYGSWMEPVNVFSSGNISIIETKNFNSAEYPDRCPPNTVFVLYRDGDKANKVHFNLR